MRLIGSWLRDNKRSVTHALAFLSAHLFAFLSWSEHALAANDVLRWLGSVVYGGLSVLEMLWCGYTPPTHRHSTPFSHRFGMHAITVVSSFVTGQRRKDLDRPLVNATGEVDHTNVTACWQESSTCWQLQSASMWVALVGVAMLLVTLVVWRCCPLIIEDTPPQSESESNSRSQSSLATELEPLHSARRDPDLEQGFGRARVQSHAIARAEAQRATAQPRIYADILPLQQLFSPMGASSWRFNPHACADVPR